MLMLYLYAKNRFHFVLFPTYIDEKFSDEPRVEGTEGQETIKIIITTVAFDKLFHI